MLRQLGGKGNRRRKSEIRNQKSKSRKKIRSPKHPSIPFRISGFGFPSDFWFRASDFNQAIIEANMPPPDTRIQSLTDELSRLRNSTQQADDQLHSLLMKITEIQLNLATQDRTLGKLDLAVNGNGKPGLVLRLDRIERVAATLVKAVWLIAGTLLASGVRFVADRW